MARMRKRSRRTGPRTTVARAARLLNRSARDRPSHTSQKPLRIKVLADLFSVFLLRVSIDIQVLADLAFILQIPHILAILLQTKKARREKTTPRAPIHASAVKNRAYRTNLLIQLLHLT